ncbi:MAG: hypothetical protein ABI266_08280 [Ginsengibacter sp.]
MHQVEEPLDTLKDIKRMMDRSSRFISLSGLSGISAGVFALIGAWIAEPYINGTRNLFIKDQLSTDNTSVFTFLMNTWLFWIAVVIFAFAFISAFLFTYFKSRKQRVPIWGNTARRLMIQVMVPIIAGGFFLIKLIPYGSVGLIAPGCLIFYGLALINASKYTLGEIKYLGYCELLLGIISLWFIGYGLYFWAFGFGFLHIFYGFYMWWKYERKEEM